MSTVLEYPSYDEADRCLDDSEALEHYRIEKARNPDALVVLDELHCGEHWRVKVYQTKSEKENFLRERIKRIFDRFTTNIDKLQSVGK
jgi:hypothetical protein